MKNIVLGTGPVGISVAKELVCRGETVKLVNRSGRTPAAFSQEEVTTIACDMMDSTALLEATRGAGYIFHCANPLYHQWGDILPVLQENAIAAALEHDAVLALSENLYMYSCDAQELTEDTPEDPPTKKGRIRKNLSDRLEDAARMNSLRWTAIRGSDYFGPWSTSQSMFGTERFLDVISTGRNPALIGHLHIPHSYTYIDDFGRALVTAAYDEQAYGRAWICPNDDARSTAEVAELFIAELTDRKTDGIRVRTLPDLLLRLIGIFDPVIREIPEMLYQKKQNYVADGRLFSDTFGFKATPLPEAVQRTVYWYRTAGAEA